jgi:uncharacterized membrane protein
MMDPFAAEWLNLLARWGHMIAGIAWIGTSFYFVALDFSLKKPAGLPQGVSGEAWEVHGSTASGNTGAPAKLPEDLIWISGLISPGSRFLLLCLQYYVNAGSYLIDPAVLSYCRGRRLPFRWAAFRRAGSSMISCAGSLQCPVRSFLPDWFLF